MNIKNIRNQREITKHETPVTIRNATAGITLIALVVTIIVLLILAAISITMVWGENGLIQRVRDSREEQRGASVQEERDMWMLDKETDIELGTNTAKSVNQIVNELVDRKLLKSDEKDIILGNAEKGIEAEGEITIGSRTIVFEEIYNARGDGKLAKGTGTEDDPILIQSIEDLVTLSNNVNNGNTYEGKIFKLVVYLDYQNPDSYVDSTRTDFGDVNENGTVEDLLTELTTSRGFKPIGADSYFVGTLDGNGKAITNLHEGQRTSCSNYGLIGKAANVTIKNLSLRNVDINTNNSWVGGAIGNYSGNCVISNVKTSGTVKSSNVTGGIVGGCDGGTIKIDNSSNNSEIIGNNGWATGGIIGYGKTDITITDSHNEGTVNGSSGTGGLIGFGEAFNSIVITKSYNSNDIIGTGSHVGGLIGHSNNGGGIHVTDSYNEAKVEGYSCVGGLLGHSSPGYVKISNCHNSREVRGTSDYSSYIGGIAGQIGNSSTMLEMYDTYNGGEVTGNYIGGLVGELQGSTQIDRCSNKNKIFSEGSGYCGGFIGYLHSSGGGLLSIKNSVNTGEIETKGDNFFTGGFVGYASTYTTVLENCYNDNKVMSEGQYTGGLIGMNSSGRGGTTITNCYNKGTVNCTKNAGGLIGVSTGTWTSYLRSCHNEGNVNVDSGYQHYAGGLVGQSGVSNGETVEECYNAGKINGGDKVGGIIGWAMGDGTITVRGSYNANNIIATGTSANQTGGIIGFSECNSTTISVCYNRGNISGTLDEIGGLIGRADKQIQIANAYNTGSVNGRKQVGGIIGYANSNFLSDICFNAGKVTSNESGNTTYGIGEINSDITPYINVSCYVKDSADTGMNGIDNEEGKIEEYKDIPSMQERMNEIMAKFSVWKQDSENINDGYPILENVGATINK